MKYLKRIPLVNLLLIILSICVLAIDQVAGATATGISFAMAAGGSVVRNSQVVDGAGWDRLYGIAAAYAALIDNLMIINGASDKVIAWYNSSTAFSSNAAQYNNFPIGSLVIDILGDAIYMHDAATTWKTEALS